MGGRAARATAPTDADASAKTVAQLAALVSRAEGALDRLEHRLLGDTAGANQRRAVHARAGVVRRSEWRRARYIRAHNGFDSHERNPGGPLECTVNDKGVLQLSAFFFRPVLMHLP